MHSRRQTTCVLLWSSLYCNENKMVGTWKYSIVYCKLVFVWSEHLGNLTWGCGCLNWTKFPLDSWHCFCHLFYKNLVVCVVRMWTHDLHTRNANFFFQLIHPVTPDAPHYHTPDSKSSVIRSLEAFTMLPVWLL